MLVKILVDNAAPPEGRLSGEWGLSVYIEEAGHKILLDTGASGRFAENAAEMGVSLKDVDCGVLSHAHYDHSDGLAAFFAENTEAPFYLRAGAGENCYGDRRLFGRYIGIQKGYLETFKNRIVYVEGTKEILPGVWLLPHSTPGLAEIGRKNQLYIRRGLVPRPDDFAHEQSLVFDTEKGLVVFNSCSHGGADNILREAQAAFPGKKLRAMLGGFHLFKTPEEDIRALARRMLETGIETVVTGHCTGDNACSILREELGGRVTQMYTGLEIEI